MTTATTAPSTPSTLRTGHVGVNVTDLERSLAFYERVLGLQVQARGDGAERRWAFLGRDGELLVTLWQQASGRFDAGRPGLHHLAFQVGTMEEVRAVEAVLGELDVAVRGDGVLAHQEGASSGGVFFADPDGTRLEVYTADGAEGAAAPSGDEPTCGFF